MGAQRKRAPTGALVGFYRNIVTFENAEIEEHLLLRFGAKFDGIVKLSGVKIGGGVDMRDGIFENVVYMFNAKIGSITLLNTKIAQQLFLDGP